MTYAGTFYETIISNAIFRIVNKDWLSSSSRQEADGESRRTQIPDSANLTSVCRSPQRLR